MKTHKSEEQLEKEVEKVLKLFREGKKMRGDHRYNIERHEWGFDIEKNDYYHKTEAMAPEVPVKIEMGEEAVRYWVKHWLSLKSFKALTVEQHW